MAGLFSWADADSYKSAVQSQQSSSETGRPPIAARYPAAVQWLLLVSFSVGLGAVLVRLGIPAALLLAPMVSAILLSVNGGGVAIPSWASIGAQGLIGCMIARMLPPSILGEVAVHWPIFILVMLAVIAA